MKKIYDRKYVAMYDKGWFGKKNAISFYEDAARYPTATSGMPSCPTGDLYKAGVDGQGLYILPAADTVVAWFCTSDGNNQEEAMARAIVKKLINK